VIGGNWLNKLGVFVLVVGIALALGHSFTHLGPAGVVSISLALGLAMLVSGAALEPRERYAPSRAACSAAAGPRSTTSGPAPSCCWPWPPA